jgi:hypothetical protein
MNSTIAFLTLFFSSLVATAQDMDFKSLMQPVPSYAKFTDPGYQVWCGSMIKGEDGKYYLFYSRWADSLKHTNWVTHSEIALAVSDHPLGPYRHQKVLLSKRDKKYWDSDVTHNPTIHRFNNKYYLYYMGNYGNGEFWNNRNHQRIGVAVAKNILGPWKRRGKPLVDVSPGYDSLITNNPAVCKGADDKYVMVYKSVGHGPMPFGGKVNHRVALSKKPDGPFVKLPNPVFKKDSEKFAAEDPYIWYQEGKYWALVKDFKGSFTNAGLSIALFESSDAINWAVSKYPLASRMEIKWEKGVQQVSKLERPQLYIENGVPKVLFAAVMGLDAKSFIVAIPLKAGNHISKMTPTL